VKRVNVLVARKRFFIDHFRGRRAAVKIRRTKGEIDSLLRLSHPQIVTLIGCYQEEEAERHLNIYALMHPVGDGDLKTVLETGNTSTGQAVPRKWFHKWFVCLALALAYMHSQRVLHEDIKPGNIIYRGDKVFFTDFSSARRLENNEETSTTAEAQATRLFAAPEAFRQDDGSMLYHGSKTDVFSLGLVFVEMLAALKGQRLQAFRESLFRGGYP
jgi:serine/threonine protein kinase